MDRYPNGPTPEAGDVSGVFKKGATLVSKLFDKSDPESAGSDVAWELGQFGQKIYDYTEKLSAMGRGRMEQSVTPADVESINLVIGVLEQNLLNGNLVYFINESKPSAVSYLTFVVNRLVKLASVFERNGQDSKLKLFNKEGFYDLLENTDTHAVGLLSQEEYRPFKDAYFKSAEVITKKMQLGLSRTSNDLYLIKDLLVVGTIMRHREDDDSLPSTLTLFLPPEEGDDDLDDLMSGASFVKMFFKDGVGILDVQTGKLKFVGEGKPMLNDRGKRTVHFQVEDMTFAAFMIDYLSKSKPKE